MQLMSRGLVIRLTVLEMLSVGKALMRIFKRFPQLNVSEVAKSIGIHKSLLSKYIYGVKKPSLQRKMQIKEALRDLGNQLMAV